MRDNINAGHAGTQELTNQVSEEISRALGELKKHGYTVQFEEVPDQNDELAITFQLGETRQVLRVASPDWRDPGTVYGTVMDRLDI
jgi:hypothetical protein